MSAWATWVIRTSCVLTTEIPTEPPMFLEGWQLGRPDLVLTMPRAYTLRADGEDVFRNFVFSAPDVGLRHVRAIEILAGNKRIVHHANVIVDRSGVVLALGFLLLLSKTAPTVLQVAFALLPSILPALGYVTSLLLY